MKLTVSMNEVGVVLVENSYGEILTECFFKAEDETNEELRHMGYQRLIQTYPADHIVAGQGIDAEELGELFPESWTGAREPIPTPPAASPISAS